MAAVIEKKYAESLGWPTRVGPHGRKKKSWKSLYPFFPLHLLVPLPVFLIWRARGRAHTGGLHPPPPPPPPGSCCPNSVGGRGGGRVPGHVSSYPQMGGPLPPPNRQQGGGAASPCCQHGRLCVVFPLLKAYPASWTSVAHFKKVCRKEDCQGFNKFFKLYQWKLHKLVFHSETWKFTCQICGRRSMHKQNFDSHIKVCENQKKNAVGVPVIGKEKRLGIKGSLPNSLLFPVSLSKQTAVRWIPWQGEFPLAWAQSRFQSLERNRD